MPCRVVLDTNVLVSALVFGGESWRSLRQTWQERRIQPLISHATTDELVRVLMYPKFRLVPEDRDALLAEYLPYAEVVDVGPIQQSMLRVRDPEDRMFLEVAVAGKADVLISGDEDLLVLRTAPASVRILSPAEFMDWFQWREGCGMG